MLYIYIYNLPILFYEFKHKDVLWPHCSFAGFTFVIFTFVYFDFQFVASIWKLYWIKHYYFILSGQNELSTNRMRLSQHHFFSKRWPWTILGFVKQIEVVIANAYSGWQDNPSCRRKTIFNLFYIGKTRKKKKIW